MMDSYLITLKILTIVETEQINNKIVILMAGFHRINSVSAVIYPNLINNTIYTLTLSYLYLFKYHTNFPYYLLSFTFYPSL